MRKPNSLVSTVLFGYILVGCRPAPHPPPVDLSTAPDDQQVVTLTGMFHTVWNGEPRYFLTDEQGTTTELLLDEALARPYGGTIAIDRKRVRIQGTVVVEPRQGVRARTLDLLIPQR